MFIWWENALTIAIPAFSAPTLTKSIVFQDDEGVIAVHSPDSGTRDFPAHHDQSSRTILFPPTNQHVPTSVLEAIVEDISPKEHIKSAKLAIRPSDGNSGWTIIVGSGYDDEATHGRSRGKRWEVTVVDERMDPERGLDMAPPAWSEYGSLPHLEAQYLEDDVYNMEDYLTPEDFVPEPIEPAPWASNRDSSLRRDPVLVSTTDPTPKVDKEKESCHSAKNHSYSRDISSLAEQTCLR